MRTVISASKKKRVPSSLEADEMTASDTHRRMERLRAAIAEKWGFTTFRPHQEEILTHVLDGSDLLATLSTGGGKSLCYQAPVLVDDAGLTIVVSPLIALMHDQVKGLAAHNMPATYIDSTVDDRVRKLLFVRIRKGQIKLLYVSPETLNTERIYDELDGVKVNRLVVDEAHCVSMWGHDFRPEYLKIPRFRRRLGNPQLLAFTATAPVLVRDDITASLELVDPIQIVGEIDRPNIELHNEHFDSEEGKWRFLLPRLRQHAKEGDATIVYCRRIRTVEELAERLGGTRVPHRTYHGDLEKDLRGEIETLFLGGGVPILVATKAFGMGVDHPRIRNVYHYEVPESLEAYYQEVGRAGRDGKPAQAVLLYDRHDIGKLRSFIQASNPGFDFLVKIYNMLWRSGAYRELAKEGPQRTFVIRRFLGNLAEDSPYVEQMVSAAIAQLQEYKIVEQWSNQLRFLVTPKDLEKMEGGFPVSPATLNAKRDRDLVRLKVMLHYANAPTSAARRLILDHFRYNTVIELVRDMPLTAFYRLPRAVIKTVCQAVADTEIPKGSLAGYLAGTNQTPGIYAGALKASGADAVRLDVEQVASLGYIRHVPVAEKTYFTVTDLGLELLDEEGAPPPPIETTDDLRRRIYSPPARRLLRQVIETWWGETVWRRPADMLPDDWWRVIREFQTQTFRICGKPVTGEQLTRYFQHMGPRSKMLLRYAKELLNYLFDNCIKT